MARIDWTKPIEFVVPNGRTCEYAGHNRFGKAKVRWSGGSLKYGPRLRVYYEDGTAVYQPAKYRIHNKAVVGEYGPEIEPRPLWRSLVFGCGEDSLRSVGFLDGSSYHWSRQMRIDDLYFRGSRPYVRGEGYFYGPRDRHAPMGPGFRAGGEKWFNRPWKRPVEVTRPAAEPAWNVTARPVEVYYGDGKITEFPINGTCPRAGYDELRPPLQSYVVSASRFAFPPAWSLGRSCG